MIYKSALGSLKKYITFVLPLAWCLMLCSHRRSDQLDQARSSDRVPL
jgi:hypothetical protein